MRRTFLGMLGLVPLLLTACKQGGADVPPGAPGVDLATGTNQPDLGTTEPQIDMQPVDAATMALPNDPPQVVFAGLMTAPRATDVALNRADRAELVWSTDTSIEMLRETPSGWQRATIESGIKPLRGVHITLKDDVPWLSYLDFGSGAYELKVAHAEGTGFLIEKVAATGLRRSEAGAPIAVDGGGNPVVYYSTSGYAEFSRRGPTDWTHGGIWLKDGIPYALRRGASGLLQLAYHDVGTFSGYLKVAMQNDAGNWVLFANQALRAVSTVSLALDALETPHLAYFDSKASQIHYSRGETWRTDVLEQTNGGDVSIGLGRGPRGELMPIVAYQKLPEADLKVARRVGGRWQIQAVEPLGELGHALSLEVDSRGQAQIFYFDVNNRALKRVRR